MKNIFYFVFTLILVESCEQDRVAIPDTGRKIVINTLVTTDSLFGVNVSASMKIDDTSRFVQYVSFENASIAVFENNLFVDSLGYNNSFRSYVANDFILPNNYFSKQVLPASGKQYKIVVSSSGLPDALATTTIPSMVKIERIDTTRIKVEKTESWQSDEKMFCDIVFTDPGNEKNFYLVYVFGSTNNCSPVLEYFNLTFQDPIIEEELNHGSIPFGVAFSDVSINGYSHRLRVILGDTYFKIRDNGYPFPTYKKCVYFRLYSITEEYFKYIQSLNLFFKNYKNPLAEPTQVYSNVEGGYGIFSGAAVSSDSLVFNF